MGLALERTRIALTRVRWCAVLLAALVLTAPGSAQGPRLIDLGTLGGNYSLGVAINDVGQVVGYSEVSGGAVHAFRWDGANGMQDLGSLGGAYSCATAINRAGQVVGYSWVNESSFHAFIWDPVNGMQDLGAPGGGLSAAIAINPAGQVVGYYGHSGTGGFRRSFIWDPSERDAGSRHPCGGIYKRPQQSIRQGRSSGLPLG